MSPVFTPARPCLTGGKEFAEVMSQQSNINPNNLLHGNLASDVTTKTGCGNTDAPWVIEVPEGQRIRLTLYDFWLNTSSSDRQAPSPGNPICLVYATIKEGFDTPPRSSTVCGRQGPRVHRVFNSASNRVEIRVQQARENPPKFILRYEGLH